MQHTIRPSFLHSRYVLQEKTPWRLENKITQKGSDAFELWGQCILGTRVEWRTLSDILRVEREHLVYLGISHIDQKEF